MGQKVWSNNRH